MNREEAIERIKTRFDKWALDNEDTKAIQTLIPELRESEDERIRKELLAVINDLVLPDEQRARFNAYLEKQKERGPLTKEEEYTLQRIIEYLEDETCPPEWISLLHDIYCLPYEKQKEQKPGEDSEYRKAYLDGWNARNLQAAREQKPAEWSEDIIRKAVKEVGLTQHQIDWFKTNVFPSKQEWSEKDKKIIRALRHALNCADAQNSIAKSGIEVSEVAIFLQDLVPSWKPSEEQLEAARYVSQFDYGGHKAALVSLYEQLKAL